MLYFEGMTLLASANGIGTTAKVPLRVPVTSLGYWEEIGFGEDSRLVPKVLSSCAATCACERLMCNTVDNTGTAWTIGKRIAKD